MKKTQVRSIPTKVLLEVFELVDPTSESNPFRTISKSWRNQLILILLFYMGLRLGELLNLQTDSFKSEFSPSENKTIYWLNVKLASTLDVRKRPPSLKNNYSQRQLPLPRFIYEACLTTLIACRLKADKYQPL